MTIINPNEVELNSVRYKLGGDGQVHPRLTSQFAPKQVIGDYNKDSDPNRSIWAVISDQTGGIGIEDMDESKHGNRSWWSYLNQEYPSFNFLSTLASSATLPTLPAIVYASADPLGIATVDTDATSWSNNFRGCLISATVVFTKSGATDTHVILNDGNSSLDTETTASAGANTIIVSGTLHATLASKIRVTITNDAGTCSGISITLATAGALGGKSVTFNNDTYFTSTSILYRIDNATGSVFLDAIMPATITDIIPSVASMLYVFLGDSYYWYRSAATPPVWVQTNSAAANLGVHWDNKLGKYSATSGQIAFAATPNSATPSWTDKGLLDTKSQGTVNSLITYSNASGTNTVYTGTTKGLVAHDYTNSLWLNTDLMVPEHADNGKGMIVQNGKLYYSAGLSVYEYDITSSGATIRNVGLDTVDGMPDEYMGSITNLVGGYGGEFYALVDASLISSSNFSSIQKYRNGAWMPVWVDGTANVAPHFGIASSTYAYRFWFGSGSTVYYQAMNRARRNPTKMTWSYASSGIYLSPWFDADWSVGNKLALGVRSLATGTTAAITVTIKYRINKTTTSLDTTPGTSWTTLDTLVAADAGVESVVTFGSGLGTAFKSIQFRVDFATGTATITPNLLYLILEYERVIPAKWGWEFIVDCSRDYNGKTPSQLLDALITAAETQTLVTFYFKNVAKNVRVATVQGTRLTGDKALGQYNVFVMEK